MKITTSRRTDQDEVDYRSYKKGRGNVYDRFLSISAVSSVVNAFKVIVLELPS
jgi:hypothetical protein